MVSLYGLFTLCVLLRKLYKNKLEARYATTTSKNTKYILSTAIFALGKK